MFIGSMWNSQITQMMRTQDLVLLLFAVNSRHAVQLCWNLPNLARNFATAGFAKNGQILDLPEPGWNLVHPYFCAPRQVLLVVCRSCKISDNILYMVYTIKHQHLRWSPHVLTFRVMFSFSAVATTLLGSRRTVNRTSSLIIRGLPTAHSTVLFPDKLHEYLLPCRQTNQDQ